MNFLLSSGKVIMLQPASSRPPPTIMAGIRGMSIYIGDPFSYPPIMQVRIKCSIGSNIANAYAKKPCLKSKTTLSQSLKPSAALFFFKEIYDAKDIESVYYEKHKNRGYSL